MAEKPSKELCRDCPQKTEGSVGEETCGRWVCKVVGKPVAYMTECPEELEQ